MMKTMPGIQFNQGITEDVEEPNYLNVSQRNQIVLEDLMAQPGKDHGVYWRSFHRKEPSQKIVQNPFHQGMR